MLASGPVAGFAGLGFEATLLVAFHLVVGILLESVEDIFVAHLAGFRPDVFCRLVRRFVRRLVRWFRLAGRVGGEPERGGGKNKNRRVSRRKRAGGRLAILVIS